MSAKTVFISYSHQDKDLLRPLVAQLKALEQAGLLDVWVDTRIDAGEKWYPDIEQAMQRAAVAVCLVSEHFLASDFCTKEEVPFLLQRAEQDGLLIIPVLLSDCPWYAHRWVEERQMLPGEGQSVRTNYATNPAAVFSRVAKRIHDKFKDPTYQPPKPRLKWTPPAIERLDLTRLPETGSALFGRDEELKLLDTAWSNDSEPRTRVLAFKAHGGVGKSTLINHWLGEMKRDHFRGATRVFGWSFYSQGVRDQGAASADIFVAEALKFFGDPAMAASPASAWDKGARLARLIGSERALLVLDGMEPLQAAQAFDRGKLRDPAIESLLRGLAKNSAGLCLITTRESLPDLARKPGFAERDLEQITPQAGRALLRTARVVGTDAELESLAQRFGPHALAIKLLGVYLHEQPGHGVGPAEKLEQLPGKKPVDRVLASFEQMLGDSAEREVLHLLGLFDRPADSGCLQALRAQPAIHGLSNRLVTLGDAEWDCVLTRLEKLRLIHTRQNDSDQQFVDAHPLIREHFADQLREKNPDAWRAAHRRLYEHLCETTPDKLLPTLEDLQPLYQAVAHGCFAGLQHEVCTKVYRDRLQRGKEAYTTKKLGALSSDLGVIACFFEQPWTRVSPKVTHVAGAWLRHEAAFRLRALGRLKEAVKPMQLALEMGIEQEDWRASPVRAGNLCVLKLLLGNIEEAVEYAEQSVTYAARSGNSFLQMDSFTVKADALYQAGHYHAAEALFRDTEQMQTERQPHYPLLYSMAGFRYCSLLLTKPECIGWLVICGNHARLLMEVSTHRKTLQSISQRATKTFKWAVENDASLIPLALDQLILARTALFDAVLSSDDDVHPEAWSLNIKNRDESQNSIMSATIQLDSAVDGLRRGAAQEFIILGLFVRASIRNFTGARTGPESAQEDLDEAWEIAERGPMKLHMADIHLHRARLFFREEKYPWESPAADLAAAEKLINECGYHRRDEELADAKKAILGK